MTGDLDDKSHRLAVKGLRIDMSARRWAIAGVLVGAVALGPALLAGGEADSHSCSDTSVSGDGNQVQLTCWTEQADDLARADSKQEILDRAGKFAGTAPTGPGPWPLVVVADATLGLKVRSSGYADGVQIGSAAFRSSVWATCRADTGFDPEPGDSTGALWYRITWPTTGPGTEFGNSSPSDPHQGWVYGGLVAPAGHDGNLPTC
ncbi:hypothetical protein [Kineosporia succinea]|uniref:Secreted protein n=1 Tax=Kineosporia succinea TaxID=84632 RepID=A0ABT9PEQ0_9ACTN|nr:hypothetical protein [Kineosporia succinea]MDP9830465.1 hypothetical protein [Kineosporia succinea]